MSMRFFPLPHCVGDKAFTLAAASGTFAILLGGVAGLPMFMVSGTPRSPFVVEALRFIDPFALQGIAVVHCCACLVAWAVSDTKGRSFSSSKELWRTLWTASKPVLTLGVLIFFYYVINDLLFKTSFDRPRPGPEIQLHVGLISKHIRNTLEGAPSGFAGRGVFIMLASLLAAIGLDGQPESGNPRRIAIRVLRKALFDVRVVGVIQGFLLLSTCAARVLGGFHFWFDILLGISLSVFVFWGLTLLLSAYTGGFQSSSYESLDSILVSMVVCFSLFGFFYSRDASKWAPSVLVMIFLSLLIQIRAYRSRSASAASRKSEGAPANQEENV
jgi:hypothetical protein